MHDSIISIFLIWSIKFIILIGISAKENQFWQQRNAYTVNENKDLWNISNIQLSILKVVLETTLDTKIANTCCVIERILNFVASLHLHQPQKKIWFRIISVITQIWVSLKFFFLFFFKKIEAWKSRLKRILNAWREKNENLDKIRSPIILYYIQDWKTMQIHKITLCTRGQIKIHKSKVDFD